MQLNRSLIIRLVGIVLGVLGVMALGEIFWHLFSERGMSVRTIYPATYFARGVGYIVGGVGLVALRKWALPAFLLITAMCRGVDLYNYWGWVTTEGVPVARIPIGELVVVSVVVVIVTWGWPELRWRAKH